MTALKILFLAASVAFARSPCSLLQLEQVAGKVTRKDFLVLHAGDSLDPGETIYTYEGSTVDLRHCDGSVLRLGESSELTFEAGDETFWDFTLAKGNLRGMAVPGTELKWRVRTSLAALGVKAGEFVLEADTDDSSLFVFEGEGLFGLYHDWNKLRPWDPSRAGRFELVKKGNFSRVSRGQKPLQALNFHLQRMRGEKPLLFGGNLRLSQGFREFASFKKEQPLFDRNKQALKKKEEELTNDPELQKLRNVTSRRTIPGASRKSTVESERSPETPKPDPYGNSGYGNTAPGRTPIAAPRGAKLPGK